ncbi:MAG: hypothetical protein ABJA02_06535 [Acidobacteriota bacterium]
MSSTQPKEESRNTWRKDIDLEAIVQVKESGDEAWKEITKVTTVSRNGAGFSLTRECKVGRLITIVLPMPAEYRVYDLEADLYPVMAIVQNCYKTTVEGKDLFHVGVGFIGKDKPVSFRNDPTQNYRIDGMQTNGMWKVVEADKPFKMRAHTRFWQRMEVTLTLLQSDTKTISKETTFTQNVSAKGVSVESDLDAQVGDKVKFKCAEFGFFSLAVVRSRKVKPDLPTTLHLEFIDTLFPTNSLVRKMQEIAQSAERASDQV